MVNKGLLWFVNKLLIRPSFLGGCIRGGIMLISHDMGPLNCCAHSVYSLALVTPHRCSSVQVLISQGPMLYKLSFDLSSQVSSKNLKIEVLKMTDPLWENGMADHECSSTPASPVNFLKKNSSKPQILNVWSTYPYFWS